MRARARASRLGLGRFEFAIACTVLAVLMSVLLAQLSHWQADTRQLRLHTAMAAVQRAVSLFQAHCLRSAAHDCGDLLIDGQTIAGAHGHPAARAEGIARLAGLSRDVRLRSGQIDGVPSLTIDVALDTSPPCEFTYVQAARAGAAPGIDSTRTTCP